MLGFTGPKVESFTKMTGTVPIAKDTEVCKSFLTVASQSVQSERTSSKGKKLRGFSKGKCKVLQEETPVGPPHW